MHALTRFRLLNTSALAALLVSCTGLNVRGDMIQELVDQVSETRLSAHIAALEYPRYTPAALDLAAEYISMELQSYGYMVIEQPYSYSKNLIARLEGTYNPERVYVVGAHYDTIANTPGADDNASGVAGMLEVARILAGRNMPYSIEFVAFTLEELGLLGSYYYVEQALIGGKNIFGMVNFEMIGYACHTAGCQDPVDDIPDCFWVNPDNVNIGDFGGVLVNAQSAFLRTQALFAVEHYIPDFEIVTMLVLGYGECAGGGFNFTRRSDHVPFWEADFPAIEFFDTYEKRNPYYHTWADSLSTLDMQFCRRNVQTGLAIILLNQDQTSVQPASDDAVEPVAVLHGAFPNPFNPSTRINFESNKAGPVSVHVYNLAGQRVKSLFAGVVGRGVQSVDWNGSNDYGQPLPSGIYLIHMRTDSGTCSSKVALIR